MNSDDIYFVYSGLHESEIFWVGQVRFFDEMGGQFDIKPLIFLILIFYENIIKRFVKSDICIFIVFIRRIKLLLQSHIELYH